MSHRELAIDNVWQTAIKGIKARLMRESNLERMKVAAAHANDVTMLQRKIEELKELVVQSDASQSHRSAMLERYSVFTAQRAQQSVREERTAMCIVIVAFLICEISSFLASVLVESALCFLVLSSLESFETSEGHQISRPASSVPTAQEAEPEGALPGVEAGLAAVAVYASRPQLAGRARASAGGDRQRVPAQDRAGALKFCCVPGPDSTRNVG